jgi:CcmD family protein
MTGEVKFVVAAYAVSWTAILGYLLRLRSVLARSRSALEHASRQGGAS